MNSNALLESCLSALISVYFVARENHRCRCIANGLTSLCKRACFYSVTWNRLFLYYSLFQELYSSRRCLCLFVSSEIENAVSWFVYHTRVLRRVESLFPEQRFWSFPVNIMNLSLSHCRMPFGATSASAKMSRISIWSTLGRSDNVPCVFRIQRVNEGIAM